MSKALTASIVIGAALSASYNNVFKTAKQKQYELGKAFADTNKKLKASDAVVAYQHKSKVGLEETAVALGLLNSAGLDGSQGGTAFSATLRQIKKAADELGFSIVRGADGQMDFVATLHNVNSALAVYDDIDERGQIIQDLFGDEGKKGLVPLLNNLDKFRQGLDEVRQAGGLVDENYQLFKDSASGAWGPCWTGSRRGSLMLPPLRSSQIWR